MDSLRSILNKDATILKCPTCSGKTFSDYGIRLLTTTSVGRTPRWKNVADTPHVFVCVKDFTPVVNIEGTYYDASEFVARDDLERFVQHQNGTIREFAT